ncbi:MAG: alpha/beta hydrolase [Acidibrevibacterium sp.]|uniref:alpha/beta hydrolase n=1 Tax=Acidibrevibacterium fodinaquatile TaxID=1969806 RepID=UPI0023A8E4EE|nr:alpha/beta hydrolase [Acidibrevibacterium fodinaquatile]MCA7120719.1 alpha/beta hydrolase [Acidibrevibacterium fodinaquatile]
MHDFNPGDVARPSVIRHALSPGEGEQVLRIFQRNASLAQLHPEDRRAFYAAMASQAPMADGVAAEPVIDGAVRGWWLRPAAHDPGSALFFVHGGGYHLGDARSYLGFASQLAARTGRAVFSVDYALAPERRFPAAFDDVMRARAWFLSRGFKQYAAVGDSAGGGLVLAMADQAAPDARLASIVVFSPWTDLSNSGPSFTDPATYDPVFKPALLQGLAHSYLDGANPHDPKASPLFGALRAMPAINVQVGADELLRDDSIRFAERAAAHGATVRLDLFEGMYHVFQRDVGSLKTAETALEIAASFIDEHWANRKVI